MRLDGVAACRRPKDLRPCPCVDETAQVEGLQVCDNLVDVAVSVPDDDKNGNPPELKSVDTTQCLSTSRVRMRRIYSYIPMSSVGVPSPRRFMTVILHLDASLGQLGRYASHLGDLPFPPVTGDSLILEFCTATLVRVT